MSLLSLLPILIVFSGGYFLIKFRFFHIIHPKSTLKFAFSSNDRREAILSLVLALAGTLGVGNISGVAIGIAIGGAGSVFWLVASALFSSAIKYAEVFLSYRSGGIGMVSVIKNAFKYGGGFLAAAYATISIILSLSMGSVFQARAISEAASVSSDTKGLLLAVFLTATALFICLLGKDRIKRAVAVIIPTAAIIYTGMCLFVILGNFDRLFVTLGTILKSAFSFKSASGGILGFIVSSGMKEGFARGLLSNEAGAGTSSFSHTSHIDNSTFGDNAFYLSHNTEKTIGECERAGIFGILEVVFDTLLICPLTALAILLGNDGSDFGGSLTELSRIFENHIGGFAPRLLLTVIIFFAISTTLCWYYYGRVALRYLAKNRFAILYTALFFSTFFIALLISVPHALFITDTALFLLSVITLSALIKKRASLRFKETLVKFRF